MKKMIESLTDNIKRDYTREYIVKECKKALFNATTFYQQDFVNYRGRTTDTNDLFNEVIAEFLCENIEKYERAIPMITRKSSYRVNGHNGKYDLDTTREEEKIAMQMFNQSEKLGGYNFIGKIIDYQTPLKSVKNDVAGKIDLLSYGNGVVRVLELKKPDSKETMLRCVLEGFTYMRTADWDKLLVDFDLDGKTAIKASPFVFSPSAQKEDMEDNRPYLHKLMKLLDSEPYYITYDNSIYKVGK